MPALTRDPQAALHGLRIAIIAEADGLAGALRDALAADGHGCHLCHGDEAGALADAPDAPALILADISDGGSAAFALCQTLRGRDGATPCRLLVMNRSGRAIDRRRATALGADAYLAMPFALADLRQQVTRLLASQQG
jgi:DNA-binding response OmpR family regulator